MAGTNYLIVGSHRPGLQVLEIAVVHQLDVRPVDVAENCCAVYQQTESG